ncbi:hypothetical protein [Desulfobacula sp.]|uniref:hypothetical protein n=1 Tax=Desulfobacula sp. TaxID=2593537 RepID=UPI0026306292|nr:hypothetical protein [Desulfobacula sp.]
MKKKINIQSCLYGITFFFITLSGFAQMPIFKRYYISDIPGLGWLADFYITHLMHYMFAGIFMGLVVYSISNFIVLKTGFIQLTRDMIIKIVIFSGLILTGSLMVIKNFSGTPFSNGMVIALDILHILFCMALLFFGVYQLIKRKKELLSG